MEREIREVHEPQKPVLSNKCGTGIEWGHWVAGWIYRNREQDLVKGQDPSETSAYRLQL